MGGDLVLDACPDFIRIGRTIVYVATEAGVRRLYVRALEAAESERIDGTEGAAAPFFSPDGRWVGFFSEGALRKVSLENRLPSSICQAQGRSGRSVGASWLANDTIVFTSGESGLFQVSADGGEPRPMTTVDAAAGELGHLWPVASGDSVLYTIRRDTGHDYAIGSLDVGSGATKVLLEGPRHVVATASGHLVYGDSENLYAAPYDVRRSILTGPAIPVGSGVHRSPGGGTSFFAVSRSGALVYASRPDAELIWVDRRGAIEPLDADRDAYMYVRLSADGSKLAYGTEAGVWVLDLERGTRQRLSDDGSYPVWRPGRDEITVFNMRNGLEQLFTVRPDGGDERSLLLDGEYPQLPMDWSPAGTALLFEEIHPETQIDLWILSEDGTADPFLVTPANERSAKFSPNGRYVAYESDESGENEVHIRDYPTGVRKWVISSGGGYAPAWSQDGKELFYRSGEHLMAVEVESDPVFRASKPTTLFKAPRAYGRHSIFDITPDGERFIMVRGDAAAFRELHVVLNWTDELERLVPCND